jgi:hypothetical protein
MPYVADVFLAAAAGLGIGFGLAIGIIGIRAFLRWVDRTERQDGR